MKNFIFDVDSTLIDSEKMYMQALWDVLMERYGYQLQATDFHRVFGIKMIDELPLLGFSKEAPVILDDWLKRLPKYAHLVTVLPGVAAMLATLHRAGCHIAVATSKTKPEYEDSVAPLQITKYFDTVVLASDVWHGKPAPDMILKALKQLGGRSEETIYVGDVFSDLLAAHHADVDFGAACWYAKNYPDFEEADYIFDQPIQVTQLVIKRAEPSSKF